MPDISKNEATNIHKPYDLSPRARIIKGIIKNATMAVMKKLLILIIDPLANNFAFMDIFYLFLKYSTVLFSPSSNPIGSLYPNLDSILDISAEVLNTSPALTGRSLG